jgi:hypothetical protein
MAPPQFGSVMAMKLIQSHFPVPGSGRRAYSGLLRNVAQAAVDPADS